MSSCSLRSLCAALCLAAAPAAQHAAEPAGPRRVALVLFEKGAPSRGLGQALLSVLSEIDDSAESISVIGERDLDRKVGPAHIDAVVACGANLRCVADIGEKADATHVLFGRATAQKGAVGMQWLLVSVGTAEIVGKLKASVADAASSGAAATQVARELLGGQQQRRRRQA